MKLVYYCFLIPVFNLNFLYAQWTVPVNISNGTTMVGTNENAGPCLAVVGDTIRITYSDRSTGFSKIMYNQSFDKGMHWETPVILDNKSLYAGFTAIASCGSSVHIVWMDSLNKDRASFYRRSLNGGRNWDPVKCLDSVTKFWPGIACSDSLLIATLNKDLSGNTEVFIKRSLDNGAHWLAEQQISHALNRSEDPAIQILGNDVHLSWNDKRSGTMNIYYCHSSDGGMNWGPETQLSTVDSYTSMVCLNGKSVDVPHGIRTNNSFDIWNAESSIPGLNWIPNQLLTNTTTQSELYPYMVRDGLQMHIVYAGPGGANYLHSADGGKNWDAPVFLSASSQPFIAYAGCTLHVIFANAGHINYMQNPTGNCFPVNSNQISSQNQNTLMSPNPMTTQTTVTFPVIQSNTVIHIYNELGICVKAGLINGNQYIIQRDELNPGIYLIEIASASQKFQVNKLLVE